jgi:hypothetical protein
MIQLTEYEELRRLATQAGHEVDDQIEAHCLRKLQRNINNDASDCLNQALVKCLKKFAGVG